MNLGFMLMLQVPDVVTIGLLKVGDMVLITYMHMKWTVDLLVLLAHLDL